MNLNIGKDTNVARKWGLLFAVLVVLAVGGLAAFWPESNVSQSNASQSNTTPPQASAPQAAAPSSSQQDTRVADHSDPLSETAMGAADAPLTVIEYSSLTCPHCAAFHQEKLAEIKARYIDTGKVRWIFRDFPFDRVGLEAAVLARCMPRDRYFRFLDVLFASQSKWAGDSNPSAALGKLAVLGGLTSENVQSCLNNKVLIDMVVKNRLIGERTHGIKSTPSFIIGGSLLQGNQTLDTFIAALDTALAK